MGGVGWGDERVSLTDSVFLPYQGLMKVFDQEEILKKTPQRKSQSPGKK